MFFFQMYWELNEYTPFRATAALRTNWKLSVTEDNKWQSHVKIRESGKVA